MERQQQINITDRNVLRDPMPQTTWVEMKSSTFAFDSTGHLIDPLGIKSYGYWAWENLAEALPKEFSPFVEGFNNIESSQELLTVYKNWKKELMPERLQVSWVTPFGITGQNLILQTKVFKGNTQDLFKESKTLYLELKSAQGNIMAFEKWRIQEGSAFGEIPLPANLPEGIYYLSIYTNWLRNFSEKYFYKASVPILSNNLNDVSIDPKYQFSESAELEQILLYLQDSQKAPLKNKNLTVMYQGEELNLKTDKEGFVSFKTEIDEIQEFEITLEHKGFDVKKYFQVPQKYQTEIKAIFQVEGGVGIPDVSNKVGVFITDIWGKGLQTEGVVLDRSGSEITQFSTNTSGRALIEFTPEASQIYKAKFYLENGQIYTQDLPYFSNESLALSIDNSLDKQELNIKINSSIKGKTTFKLLAIQDEKIVYQIEDNVKKGKTWEITVDKKEIPKALINWVLLDEYGKWYAERVTGNFLEKTDEIQINISQNDYSTEEQVNIKIDNLPTSGVGNIVVKPASWNTIKGLEAWNWTQRLQQYISPQEIMEWKENPQNFDIALLMTPNNSEIWEILRENKEPFRVRFAQEQGITIIGKVVDKNQKTVPQAQVTFLIPSSEAYLLGEANNKGEFNFSTLDFNNGEDVLIQARDSEGKKEKEVILLEQSIPQINYNTQ